MTYHSLILYSFTHVVEEEGKEPVEHSGGFRTSIVEVDPFQLTQENLIAQADTLLEATEKELNLKVGAIFILAVTPLLVDAEDTATTNENTDATEEREKQEDDTK